MKILNAIRNVDALEEWFDALLEVIKSGKVVLGVGGFHRAWETCKIARPDLFERAFGSWKGPEQEGGTDEGDSRAALQAVGQLANRIQQISGMDFRFGWQFVRDELPEIFNRQFSNEQQVLNRERERRDATAIQKRAALEIERLTNRVMYREGLSRSHALQRVMNCETVLHELATAKIKPAEAFERDPELRNRLK